jgi:sterol desaturase/sphingolipid hydroxylase (fatty acid hydroxylase superfamily)
MAVLALGALVLMEVRHPLRRQRQRKLRRAARNPSVAALSGLTVLTLEQPLIAPLCRTAALKRWGLLHRVPIPRGLRIALGIVLLDYTLYVWHVMTHKVPLLWRFHHAHHADLDWFEFGIGDRILFIATGIRHWRSSVASSVRTVQ